MFVAIQYGRGGVGMKQQTLAIAAGFEKYGRQTRRAEFLSAMELVVPWSELVPTEALVADLRQLIAEARHQAAVAVNAGLTLLYWKVGDRIRREVLGSERAGYGEQIVATLSHRLVAEFGRGFERTNLTRMLKFAVAFLDPEIVATLSHQLNWSHFRELLPLAKPLHESSTRR